MSAHCWADRSSQAADEHGFGSEQWADAFVANGTCMLEAGHEGPHEFTPDDQIVVEFAPEVA